LGRGVGRWSAVGRRGVLIRDSVGRAWGGKGGVHRRGRRQRVDGWGREGAGVRWGRCANARFTRGGGGGSRLGAWGGRGGAGAGARGDGAGVAGRWTVLRMEVTGWNNRRC